MKMMDTYLCFDMLLPLHQFYFTWVNTFPPVFYMIHLARDYGYACIALFVGSANTITSLLG